MTATRRVQERLEDRDVAFKSLIFLRTDIYEHFLRQIPDKGKDTAIDLDWDDPSLFEEIVRRRIETSTELDGTFTEVWHQVADSHVGAEDTFNYLVGRTLMRPRDLLLFLRGCIEVALNRGNDRIEIEDILQAERRYSDDMLLNLADEISDTRSEFADSAFAFHGAGPAMSSVEVRERLETSGVAPEKIEECIELLLRFAFLGIRTEEAPEEMYAYQVHSNLRKLLYPVEVGKAQFVVHPAFREALEIA